MASIPTIEPMDYEEFRSLYEEDQRIPMSSALDKTAKIAEELPQSAVFGSLTSHPDIYGVNKLQRPTDRTVDLVTTEEEIAEIAEEHDVWTPQDNCYFFDHNGWAVGLMAVEQDVFESNTYDEPVRISKGDLESAKDIETEAGTLSVLEPKINYGMKARRYTESVLEKDYVKTNDLADMASMSMKQARKGDNYNSSELAEALNKYTEGRMPLEKWIEDTQIRTDAHLNTDEWECLEEELNEIKEQYKAIGN
ncbi:MAG: hypothetical protein ACI977_000109 [Candidatus Nanohaloarchaea archaeon]|jgi:hypothetical protein